MSDRAGGSSPPRRKALRWSAHDYSTHGAYFVTVCAAGRAPLFGWVHDDAARLSVLGRIVVDELVASARLREETHLDEFVVMPNHLHAIVWIVREDDEPRRPSACAGRPIPGRPAGRPYGPEQRGQGPAARSLGSLLAGFKAAVTHRARMAMNDPALSVWQRGYHDRVIRDDDELARAREYVLGNPAAWSSDSEYTHDRADP